MEMLADERASYIRLLLYICHSLTVLSHAVVLYPDIVCIDGHGGCFLHDRRDTGGI